MAHPLLAPYLQLLPTVLQIFDFCADDLMSEVPLLDHVLTGGADVLDAGFMAP